MTAYGGDSYKEFEPSCVRSERTMYTFNKMKVMRKEDLLKLCRYYKGEKKNPFMGSAKESFWKYEEFWCNLTENSASFSKMIDDYLRAGLRTFCEYDGTPVTLKALLYNRFCNSNEMVNADDFKRWYKDYSA